MRSHRLLLFGILLLLAFGLRERGPAGGAAGAVPLSTIVVDDETAWQLRRVELALAADQIAQFDRLAQHPVGAACDEGPVYAGVLTAIARLAGGAAVADGALETVLAHVGPLASLLLLLLVYLVARRLGGGVTGALAAVAVLVAWPVAVELGLRGRLSCELFQALLLLVQLALVHSALRAELFSDRLQSALLCGIVTGVGCATGGLFLYSLPPVWLLLLATACSHAEAEDRRSRSREALLLLLTAAAVSQLPIAAGPWEAAPPGPVRARAALALTGLLAGCAPFALAWMHLRPGTWIASLAGHLARGRTRSRLYLALLAAAFAVPACDGRSDGLLLSVVLALLLGTLLVPALPEGGARLRPLALVLLVAGAAWGALRSSSAPVPVAEQAARRDVIAGLCWLREHSPSPGPWNAARAPQDWGVLCAAELSSLTLYHARRPVCVAPARAAGSSERDAEALAALSAVQLPSVSLRLHALGARYVVSSGEVSPSELERVWSGASGVPAEPGRAAAAIYRLERQARGGAGPSHPSAADARVTGGG